MPIGDPVYSDEESDLSDYAGPDEDLGFDFNFRTPIGGLTASVPPDARGGDCALLLRGDIADESAERAKPPRLLREIPAAHDGHGRPQCGRFNRDGTLFAYFPPPKISSILPSSGSSRGPSSLARARSFATSPRTTS